MKFKKNYAELPINDEPYFLNRSTNHFFNALTDLFIDYKNSYAELKETLLNSTKNKGIISDLIEVRLKNGAIFLRKTLVIEDGYPDEYAFELYDYLISLQRETLIGLIDDWSSLVDKKHPQIYLICKNGAYCITDILPEDIESYTDYSNPTITFAKKYINLTKHDDNYVIEYKSNLFLNALAMLLNDVTSDTSWFKNDLINSSYKTIEGQKSCLDIAGEFVVFKPSDTLLKKLQYYNYYEIEISRTDLVRITNEWDALVQKDAKEIFIIYKDNQYSVVDTLFEELMCNLDLE